jgi:uncharacterized protein
MTHAINWFEIPTRNMDAAVRFYEKTLAVTLKREDFGGQPHAVFPAGDPKAVSGAIVVAPHLTPGPNGPVIYLNCADGVTAALARAAAAGAKVVVPHTHIGDNGWIAVVADLDGNHVGLHAMQIA